MTGAQRDAALVLGRQAERDERRVDRLVQLTRLASVAELVHEARLDLFEKPPAVAEAVALLRAAAAELATLYEAAAAAAMPLETHGARRTGGVL